MKPPVATFVFGTRVVFRGEDGQVDCPVPKDTRDGHGQAFEAGKVEAEGRVGLMK